MLKNQGSVSSSNTLLSYCSERVKRRKVREKEREKVSERDKERERD